MSDYLKQLEEYLIQSEIIEIEKLTIENDSTPFGTEAIENEGEIPIKDGDSLTVHSSRIIGHTPKRVISIKAKEIDDRRVGTDEGVYVWNPIKKCIIKRKYK